MKPELIFFISMLYPSILYPGCCCCYCCSVAKLYATLCDPIDCSPPGSFVHGILQVGILEYWRGSVSSITQSHLTLCNPMNCSTPGLPVHHKLLEFIQTHVHQSGDAIQPSVVPFPSCPQSLPASGSFLMSHLFA